MSDERQPLDPTRKLLRVFGVTATEYEERMTRLIERARGTRDPGELMALADQALELSAGLDERLRDMASHVLSTQSRVLGELRAIIEDVRRVNPSPEGRTPG